MRYALVANDIITNVIELELGSDYTPPPDHELIEAENAGIGWLRVDGVFVAPPVVVVDGPNRISKSDFRRLLTGSEAAMWQALKKQTAALTPADYIAAFDPETPQPELQILIAVEDVIEQFGLPAEFIELDHPDTAQGLQLLALTGMFGPNAETRISRILSGLAPE